MNDEQAPLSLAELAEVESPEVVRAALSRFRKRLIVRTVLVPLAIAAVFGIPRLLPDTPPSREMQFRMSRTWQDIDDQIARGRVEVVLLDARRLTHDPEFGLRLIARTDALRRGEHLVAEPGFFGLNTCRSGPRRPVEPSPPVWVSARGERTLIEMVVICPLGTTHVTIELGAFAGRADALLFGGPALGGPGDSEPFGPGMHTQAECALPLNEGVCTLAKRDGSYRVLDELTFDIADLGIEDRITKESR